jgi:uncharacterized protein (DUF488 family)
MKRVLCTIGFAGKTAEEFFALLQDARVAMLIDVRQNRSGQLSGFAKDPDLEFFLRKIGGIAYRHEPLLAPEPELLKGYRKSKDWPAYEAGFLDLMKKRGVPEKVETSSWPEAVALLCSEPGPEKCHRRLVAELLAEHWNNQEYSIEIRHLVAARMKTGRKRQKKPG